MIERAQEIKELMKERILILDGAMGTMIQRENLQEDDYRGEIFKDHTSDLKGNNDLLNLTRPDIIKKIHLTYLRAGADIIECNSFNGTKVSQSEYGLEDHVYDINYQAAKIAKEAAQQVSLETPNQPRFVAGVLGPTGRTASLSPDVNDPAFRNVDFDELVENYVLAAGALMDGGADILLIETVFDTLNAKAAIFAGQTLFEQREERLPIMISGTITDASGRTLSGQTAEAFWYSVRHADPLTIGLNCALGAEQLRQHVATLSQLADTGVSAYPNAGLPNELGEYDESAELMANHLDQWMGDGLVNIVGGCCGTTPDHIKAIAEAAKCHKPRMPREDDHKMKLSGLEPFQIISG